MCNNQNNEAYKCQINATKLNIWQKKIRNLTNITLTNINEES